MDRGGETIMIEFSEDGRPISETNRSFVYNANNQLTRSVVENSWFILATNYSYDGDLLTTYNTPSIGSNDVVVEYAGEISYENSSIRRSVSLDEEILYLVNYTFLSTDYKYLTKKEVVYFNPNSVRDNKLYEYEYNADFNLIAVKDSDVNPTTGNAVLKYSYAIEYDEMKNPFGQFANHNPIVFGLMRFTFDETSKYVSETIGVDAMVRRNGNHNITAVSQVNVNSGDTFNWNFEYVYNADDYPTEKMGIDENGVRIYTMAYRYY